MTARLVTMAAALLLATLVSHTHGRELRAKSIEKKQAIKGQDCPEMFQVLKDCEPDNDAEVGYCCEVTLRFWSDGCFCDGIVMGFAGEAPWLKNGLAACAARRDLDLNAVDESKCADRIEASEQKCSVSEDKLDKKRVKHIANFAKLWRLTQNITWSIEQSFGTHLAPEALTSAGLVPVQQASEQSAVLPEAITTITPIHDILPSNITKSSQHSKTELTVSVDTDNDKQLRLVFEYEPCTSNIRTMEIRVVGVESTPVAAEDYDMWKHMLSHGNELGTYPQNSMAPHFDDDNIQDDVVIEVSGNLDESDKFTTHALKHAIHSGMESMESSLPKSIAFWMHDAAEMVDSVLEQMFPNTKPLLSKSDLKEDMEQSHLEVKIDFGSLRQTAGMGDATFRADTLSGGAVKVDYEMDVVTESTARLEPSQEKPFDSEDDIVTNVDAEVELDDLDGDTDEFEVTLDIEFGERSGNAEDKRYLVADTVSVEAELPSDNGEIVQDGGSEIEFNIEIEYDVESTNPDDFIDEEQERMRAADASMEGHQEFLDGEYMHERYATDKEVVANEDDDAQAHKEGSWPWNDALPQQPQAEQQHADNAISGNAGSAFNKDEI